MSFGIIRDELSATRGHDVHRLFADARKRQLLSGRESSGHTAQGMRLARFDSSRLETGAEIYSKV